LDVLKEETFNERLEGVSKDSKESEVVVKEE
jgi:hypothetical protein